MNIKKSFLGLLAILFLIVFCSCAPQVSDEPSTSPSQTIEPTSETAMEPTPEPTVTPEPVLRSYTTGFPIEAQPVYKPLGVMIENSTAARPQYGLQTADIVYEAPVEGCTRFFCIYNDTLPEKVGPVRSARLYYIKMQQEWDCAYVHFGGPESGKSNVYLASSDHIETRINFIKGTYNDYYWRDSNKPAPHNAFTDIEKCQEIIEQESTVHTFQYANKIQYAGQDVSKIILPFYSGEVTYNYDADRNLFLRYMGEKEFKDAETNKAVEVQNLIVQYNRFYHGNEVKGRWLCDQLGSGNADFFVGGKHIEGTWERETFDTPTIYKDNDGNEIVLLPGNTWISVHPQEIDITVKY